MNNILFCNFKFFIILVKSNIISIKLFVAPLELFRDPDRIQTCNLLIRSQMLYSVEPRGLFLNAMQR